MEGKERDLRKERWLSNFKKLAVAAVVLIFVFLAGFIPSCMSARDAQERSTRLQHKLTLADLHVRLGMTSYEVNRNNYANAAQTSTDFFNGLKVMIDTTTDEGLKQKLQAIGMRRDEITTNLAQADPGVKEKLAQMFADFFQITATQH